MRKDAKLGMAIGAAIVAVAIPWVIIAKLHRPQPTALPSLFATSPATQPARAIPATTIRYYRDRAGNLYRRSSGAAPMLIEREGAYVTCPIRHGRAYAILDNRGGSVKILRCAASGSLLGTIKVTDDDFGMTTSLESMILLPTGYLFIEGEINPSLGLGLEVGKTAADCRCFLGFDFTWNTAGKSVAYFCAPPHGAPPDIPSEVWIDGRPVRDIPQADENKLRWEPDGITLEVHPGNSPAVHINARTAPALP